MIGDLLKDDFACAVRNAILENISEEALVQLEATKQIRLFEAGERLFTEGETPEAIFVVCSGEINLFMSSGNGKTLPLRTAASGEILGLSALLGETPYDFTAQTSVRSKVGVIGRDQVFRFFGENQELGIRFLELLSRDVHSCYELVRSFSERPTRHRM
jgi:CRP/FNR family transcriptional regulator, cyclic AMP receptor protein